MPNADLIGEVVAELVRREWLPAAEESLFCGTLAVVSRETSIDESHPGLRRAWVDLQAKGLDDPDADSLLRQLCDAYRRTAIITDMHVKMAEAIVRSRYNRPTDRHFDDLISKANEALLEALSKYTPTRLDSYWSYARYLVHKRVIDELRRIEQRSLEIPHESPEDSAEPQPSGARIPESGEQGIAKELLWMLPNFIKDGAIDPLLNAVATARIYRSRVDESEEEARPRIPQRTTVSEWREAHRVARGWRNRIGEESTPA